MDTFFIIDKKNINIDPKELRRRLSVSKEYNLAFLSDKIAKVKEIISPKCCYTLCDVTCDGNCIDFGFMKVESFDLAKVCKNSKRAVFFAVTCGFELEREQNKLSKLSALDFFITDACGSALAEAICDYAEEEIKNTLGPTYSFSKRFSPGYGDFTLEHQRHVLSAINAEKLLGITISESLLMIPQKSITAVMFFDKATKQ